jgi:hypothetical protein
MIWDDKIGFGTAYYAEYHLQSQLAAMPFGAATSASAGQPIELGPWDVQILSKIVRRPKACATP